MSRIAEGDVVAGGLPLGRLGGGEVLDRARWGRFPDNEAM